MQQRSAVGACWEGGDKETGTLPQVSDCNTILSHQYCLLHEELVGPWGYPGLLEIPQA